MQFEYTPKVKEMQARLLAFFYHQVLAAAQAISLTDMVYKARQHPPSRRPCAAYPRSSRGAACGLPTVASAAPGLLGML